MSALKRDDIERNAEEFRAKLKAKGEAAVRDAQIELRIFDALRGEDPSLPPPKHISVHAYPSNCLGVVRWEMVTLEEMFELHGQIPRVPMKMHHYGCLSFVPESWEGKFAGTDTPIDGPTLYLEPEYYRVRDVRDPVPTSCRAKWYGIASGELLQVEVDVTIHGCSILPDHQYDNKRVAQHRWRLDVQRDILQGAEIVKWASVGHNKPGAFTLYWRRS